jgi:hypothetical protein
MTDFTAKIVQHSLSPHISEEWLQELRERTAAEREAELLARKILGREDPADLNSRFIDHLMNFPKIDCDDSIFARHPDRGESNVPG